MNRRLKAVLFTILLLTVGFAAVTTTLVINGGFSLVSDTEGFESDILFTRAEMNDGVATIGDKGKSITFTGNEMKELGSIHTLEFDITNKSRQYDAIATINCTGVAEEYKEYITITPDRSSYELGTGKTTTGNLKIKLIKSYTGEDKDLTFTCEIQAAASERESLGDNPNGYTESVLDGAEPVLGEGMIPITLADNGEVTYANIYDKWYSYENKIWANAVILVDNPSKQYNIGDPIQEEDIESYFVWIPKFKYKLWNTGTASKNAHEIEIEFTAEDTIDEEGISCATPMTSGNVGNCNNGEWMTHPAFISFDVTGFWVGKYETGYNGATSTTSAEVLSNDSSEIIVKPNVYSWRSNTIRNFFEASYNYKRELDSHMMKNTEWGAVAYLSHSKYGTNKEVNINNNSSYKTGYSALPSTNQQTSPGVVGDGSEYNQPYNTSIGYLASTTGNITGIYDMSGGSIEYMASMRENTFGSSGFDKATLDSYDTKYYDIYNPSSSTNTYQYAILGDATMEMGPFQNFRDGDSAIRYHNSWYGDYSYFVEATYPWFQRGGGHNIGVLAGQFYFAREMGRVHNTLTSRLVLAP